MTRLPVWVLLFALANPSSVRPTQALAAGRARSIRHAASLKAHFRWALPISLQPLPCFLPALSWSQRTSRA